MNTIESNFLYKDNQLMHHHFYLKKPMLSLISNELSLRCLHENKNKIRILDIGCGNGSFSNVIAQLGYQVVGIEESTSGIEIANKNFSNCRFIQGSIYDMPYEKLGDKFDMVIAVDVIEHLFYPRELARAAKNCLKKQGKLIITTPYHGYFKNLAIALAGKWDKHHNALWDGGHIKFFSVQTLRELLSSENYLNINFRFAGRIPFLWKDMICYSQLGDD